MSGGMGLQQDAEMVTYPLLISIPHGGDTIPPEVREMVGITRRDIFYDGDALTREIYDFGKSVDAVIETPIARAIVDVNRASDDRPPRKTRTGIPWIQIEINRKLYLNETYFDPERLRVDQRIIQELRERISDAIVRFLTVL